MSSLDDQVAEITKEECDAHGIARVKPSPFEEKRWFKYRELLGILLFDHDGEWGWVVLAKHVGRSYAAIDIGASKRTSDEAILGMRKSFQVNAGVALVKDYGPATLDEAVRIVATATGMPEEQLRRGVNDFMARPRPRNN